MPVSAHEPSGYDSSDDGDKESGSDVKTEDMEIVHTPTSDTTMTPKPISTQPSKPFKIKPQSEMRQQRPPHSSQTEMEVTSPYSEEPPYYPHELAVLYRHHPQHLLHDSNRPSYASPTYSHAQQPLTGWQGMTNHGSMNPSYYPTSAGSSLPPLAHDGSSHQYQPLPMSSQLPTALPPLIGSFDGLPARAPQETQPAFNQMRIGSIGHAHHLPHGQHSFQPWVSEHAGFGPDIDIKMDHSV